MKIPFKSQRNDRSKDIKGIQVSETITPKFYEFWLKKPFKIQKHNNPVNTNDATVFGTTTPKFHRSWPKLPFKKLRSKKVKWIGLAVLFLILIGAGLLTWWHYVPVATVDGQKISRAEYNTEQAKMDKFYKYNNDENAQKSVSTSAKNELIEEKIILGEAQKRGITVSDQEINAGYNEIVKQYPSEEAYIKAIKAAYDWTPELTKYSIKIRLLTQKLKDQVLKGYDVMFMVVRYDMGTDEPKEDPLAKPRIDNYYNQILAGRTIEQIGADPSCQNSICHIDEQKLINEETSKAAFFASKGEDWAAISKLKNVGDHTPVVKSSGGYYVIYRVDKVYGGSYNTWEEFINSCKDKYVSYNPLSKIASALQTAAKWLSNIGILLFGQHALAIGPCPNGVPNTYFNPVEVYGTVSDANTLYLPSVDVNETITDLLGQCANQWASQSCEHSGCAKRSFWVGYNNYTPTLDHQVSHIVNSSGNSVRISGNYFFLNDQAAECHYYWKWVFSKTGYITVEQLEGRDVFIGTNGMAKEVDAFLTPIPIIPHSATITGFATANGVANATAVVGQTVVFDNGENTSNLSNVGADRFNYSITGVAPTSGGAPLSPAGLEVNSTVPVVQTAAGTYCRTITAYGAPAYAVYSNNPATACVTVINPWALAGSSSVSPPTIEVGDNGSASANFTHNIQNVTPYNMDQGFSSQVVDGSGAAVTGVFSNAALGAWSWAPTRSTTKSFPPDTANGTVYCEQINFWPRAYNDAGAGSSNKACVTVYQNRKASYGVTISSAGDYERGASSSGAATIPVTASVRLISPPPCKGLAGAVNIDHIILQISGNKNGVLKDEQITVEVPNCSTTLGNGSIVGSFTWDISKAWLDTQPIGSSLTYTANARFAAGSFSNTISPSTISTTLTIYEVPYARFYGNDIHATGSGGTPQGQIFFNSNGNDGSADQYAAIATNLISMVTAAFRGDAPSPPNGLKVERFNNWSGNERDVSGVLPSSPTGTFNGGALPNVAGYYIPASSGNNISISGSSGIANKVTVKTDGSINITGDIKTTIPSGLFSNATTPVVLLIAGRDIYINSNVKQIDAILIAGGKIYTCASGFSEVARSSWQNQCNTKLTINGAVGAPNIRFARSIGTRLLAASGENNPTTSAAGDKAGVDNMNASTGDVNHAAEVINFPAYLYFATPYLTDTSKTGYQSIFNAAPLL